MDLKRFTTLAEGWHHHGAGKYTAWGAELDHHQGELHCPKCEKVVSRAALHGSPVRDGTIDNEVTHWEHQHNCGAKLTVFNDDFKPVGNLVENQQTADQRRIPVRVNGKIVWRRIKRSIKINPKELDDPNADEDTDDNQMVGQALTSKDSTGKWIDDFIHSKNPKFKGKSKEKRRQMAIAASYNSRNEENIQEEDMLDEGKVGQKAVHVVPTTKHKNGKPCYRVVKSSVDRVKAGEHLTDTELDDLAELGHKVHMTEESLFEQVMDQLFEGRRGRPRKNPLPVGRSPDDDEHEADRHIVMQIRKAQNLNGLKHVEFANGEKVQIPRHHANQFLVKYDSLKPGAREEMQKKAQKSHAEFLSAINS